MVSLNLWNFDLLTVGIAVAATILLGLSVYVSDNKSVPNKTFFLFSLTNATWGVVNYFSYQFTDPSIVIWLLRSVMFLAVFQAIFLYRFFLSFPVEKYKFSRRHNYILIPVVLLTATLTLTPLVFEDILNGVIPGEVAKVKIGLGLVVFALVAVGLVVKSIFVLITKAMRETKENKGVLIILFVGTTLMFAFIVLFNFILPVVFSNVKFIPFGALFTLPFVVLTSYAVLKRRLFNIKTAATSILTFILAIVTFIEVIFADELSQIIFRSSVFMLVLVFGILLIRSVQREVSQREKIEILAKDLSLANDKLKDLDRQKTEFLSIASHQLRAPLTAIKGYSSLILENSFGEVSEKVRGAVDVIFQSSQKLVTVIEDFLNITRIELGKMKYDMSEIDMKQMVETAIKELRHQVETRNLSLNFNVVEGVSYKVKADSGKIAQVITNLIDNAIKYTKEGGINISLSAGENGNRVRLAVKDTGIGLTPETASHLFEKFTRAMDAGKTNIIGTGLGLYVAKQIVEAHKGKIWVESEGPGKGSTFYVELQ